MKKIKIKIFRLKWDDIKNLKRLKLRKKDNEIYN